VKYYQRSHRLNQLVSSLSQGGRDVVEMDRLLAQGPEPRFTGATAEEVSRLDPPDLTGFTVVQDSWIMDLRHWKPAASGRPDAEAYAYHSRRLMVMKTDENSGNNVFRWRLLPRGPEAAFRFPHQDLRPTLRKC